MSALIDKRLVFVTGKGGVGRTTVAAALGLLAARAGRRVVVCEVAEQKRLPALFGREPAGGEEVELAPGLCGVSVDPERAKEEWLRYQLRSGTLAGLLGGSRVFQYLTAAAPGLTELVTMGKLWDLAQLERRTEGATFDLAIVDAPATGHGLALLRAPLTYASVARVGPIRRQALRIHEFVADPALTGVVGVALPEEMPVAETIELEERLRTEVELDVDAIVVNGLRPERLGGAEVKRLEAIAGPALVASAAGRPAADRPDGGPSAATAAALATALAEHRRVREQRSQLRRLRRAARAPVSTLPYLFEPDLGLEHVERLSRVLERRL